MPQRALLAKLCQLLLDHDLAECERVRSLACPVCGGPLHRADFPRKPRGLPPALEPLLAVRISLCCGREGCRLRQTPASVRFFGRRLYFGALVVLLCSLRGGLLPQRVAFLRRVIGVSRRTLERWRSWWTEDFADSAFWRGSSGRFADGAGGRRALPRSLWVAFRGRGIVASSFDLLRFLAPLTSALLTLDEGSRPLA